MNVLYTYMYTRWFNKKSATLLTPYANQSIKSINEGLIY